MIAEDARGETVGDGDHVPDINQVLKRMNGRLLPIGWWHYLNRRRIVDRCRVGFLGVKPAYQHTAWPRASTPSTSTWPSGRASRAARWAGSWRPTRR